MYRGPFIIYSSGAGIKSLLTFHNDQSIWIGVPIKLNLTLYFINTLLRCNPLSVIFCLILEKIYLIFSKFLDARCCKSLPFLFSSFRKGRLLYIRPVGWSVGWSVGVTINFFNIYRHTSLFLT